VAIYHLTTKPLPRKSGRCAPAAAAYRCAAKVRDEITGELFDYTRKRGVEHTEIVLSTKAARQDIQWARDRQALWNAAERAEKRKDARTAREYEVALPHELKKAERIELARRFAAELADRYNVAVDFAVHKPHRDGNQKNFHAHLLATTREITPTGLGEKTSIELSNTKRIRLGLDPTADEIKEVRARWAELTNEFLAARGHDARIDHRSLADQGIDRTPTVHLGPTVSGMERKGIRTEVGDRIREQRALDAQARLERAAEIGRLDRESKQIQESILVLSTDISAAKAARDVTPEREKSISERQQTAAERWAAKYDTPTIGGGQPKTSAEREEPGLEQKTHAKRSKDADREISMDDDN
jgi:ATP-dependent exoDNAse (exonuclease V) alpha subunit